MIPQPPRPSDFGLEQNSIDQVRELVKASQQPHPNKALVMVGVWIVMMIGTFYRAVGTPWLAAAFVVGIVYLFIASAISQKLFDSLATENPTLRRANTFLSAYAAYEQRLAEIKAMEIRKQESYWRGLTGRQFETEVGLLFEKIGYNVEQTAATNDGGVDLVLRREGIMTIVQCKAHAKRIPVSVLRELSASMVDFGATSAIIACFEGLTKTAEQYIANKPIHVLKLEDVLRLQRDPVIAEQPRRILKN